MATSGKVKIFVGDEYVVAFNGEDMSLTLHPLESRQVSSADGGTLDRSALEIFSRDRSPATTLELPLNERSHIERVEPEGRKRPALSKLSLVVANECNMACGYCYANKGTYYTSGMLMDERTALNAVNFVTGHFSDIGHVNFFGGEPTLNSKVIALVCAYFVYLHGRGVISRVPTFGLTTNGYVLDNDVKKILTDYGFSVTLSLDGPREIHDRLRVGKNGVGTFDAVAANAKKIIELGITPEFECTYTHLHYSAGIDIVNLMDFFHETFRCRTLHAPMVAIPSNSPWFIPLETARKVYRDAVAYSVSNLTNGVPKSLSVATRLLNSLGTKTPIVAYCSAGTTSLSINADGNVFTCFMLTGGEGYCCGNVNGNSRRFSVPEIVGSLLNDVNKWKNHACLECWAQPLCFGCLAEDLVREGLVLRRSATPGESVSCDFRRDLIETFIMSAAEACLRSTSSQGR